MQKILRRVAQAERQVARRSKRSDKWAYRSQLTENIERQKEHHEALRKDIRAAKQAMKEQWELGPLAPRKDIGELEGPSFGALSQQRYQGLESLSDRRREERCKWLGGSKNLNLKVGDRVVLLEGPDKGKIGSIREIDATLAEVTVEGLNIANMRLPDHVAQGGQKAVALPLPIPISAIRLVHPIKNEVTGETRDVIINQLIRGPIYTDKVTGHQEWTRIVPGLNISIPWPAEPEVEHETHAADTLRIDLEEKTFVPTLLRPPMPEQILDELRNKYSKFRTRHTPEYVAKLEAENADKTATQQLSADMRTPLQEFHREERKSKKKKGKPRLTTEMLEKIGEVIARNREAQLNATGVTDVAPDGTSQARGVRKEAPLST